MGLIIFLCTCLYFLIFLQWLCMAGVTKYLSFSEMCQGQCICSPVELKSKGGRQKLLKKKKELLREKSS